VSVALGEKFVEFEEITVEFNDQGLYRAGAKTKVMISKKEFNEEAFMEYMVSALFN
jgi:hypothetical protein